MKNYLISDPILFVIVIAIVLVILAIVGMVVNYVRGSYDKPMNMPVKSSQDEETLFLKAVASLYTEMEDRLQALARNSRGTATIGKILILIQNTTRDWVDDYREEFPDRIPEDFSVNLVSVHNGVGSVSYPKEFQQHIRMCQARGYLTRK